MVVSKIRLGNRVAYTTTVDGITVTAKSKRRLLVKVNKINKTNKSIKEMSMLALELDGSSLIFNKNYKRRYVGNGYNYLVIRTNLVDDIVVIKDSIIAISNKVDVEDGIVVCEGAKYDKYLYPLQYDGSREHDGKVVMHPISNVACVEVKSDFGTHYFKFDEVDESKLGQSVRFSKDFITLEENAEVVINFYHYTYKGETVKTKGTYNVIHTVSEDEKVEYVTGNRYSAGTIHIYGKPNNFVIYI